MKKWIIASAVVLLFAGYAMADSGRETLRNPPQEIEMLSDYSSTETWASRIKDANGNIVYEVDDTGQELFRQHTDVDMAGLAVYTIDKANGSEFWIDDHESTDGTRDSGSGVSILLPKITQAYDGYVARVYKAPNPFSGTTDVCVSTVPWSSGTTDFIWNVTSGATNESSGKVSPEVIEIDAVGDWLEFKAVYGATGSTWFQTGRYIQ